MSTFCASDAVSSDAVSSDACLQMRVYDAKDPDSKFPPIEPLRPPKGAPNVLIVLIDDCGFGATSAFGGPCQTPNVCAARKRQVKRRRTNYHSPGCGWIVGSGNDSLIILQSAIANRDSSALKSVFNKPRIDSRTD